MIKLNLYSCIAFLNQVAHFIDSNMINVQQCLIFLHLYIENINQPLVYVNILAFPSDNINH